MTGKRLSEKQRASIKRDIRVEHLSARQLAKKHDIGTGTAQHYMKLVAAEDAGVKKRKPGRPPGSKNKAGGKTKTFLARQTKGEVVLKDSAQLVRTIEQVLDLRMGRLFQALGQLLIKGA